MATRKQAVAFEKMLLKHLRDIGKETEAQDDDSVMSNIEALARLTWKEALGYTYTRTITGKDGEEKTITERIAPDRYAKQMLFDHLLGKPKPQTAKQLDDKKPKAPPAHEKVSESLTGHLNEIAEKSHADNGSGTRGNKALTRSPISERLRILGVSKNGADGS